MILTRLLSNNSKPITCISILVFTSITTRRRHSQLDPPVPAPELLIIPVLEPFETISEKFFLNDVDSTTFSPLYHRPSRSDSAFKHTPSSLDNLLDTSSETTIQRPRHR